MPASVWTGYLTFGLISMPVHLYSGARGSRVAFHMLHRLDHVRVKQQLVCPNEDRPVGRDEIVKGFEYSKGEYVVIEPEEIKKIEPKTAKAMEILEFVKEEEVDPVYFESSYYLMPEEAGRRPYSLLAKVMQESSYLAVAKLTMHNREYTVLLRPHRNGLMLHTMFYQDEVRQLEHFGEVAADLREGEIKVAQQLIEALAGKWEPSKYRDSFEENLRKMIQARLEGKEVTPVEKPRKPAPVVDLMAALKQSLEQTQAKKPPQRVTEAQAANEVGVGEHAHAPRKRAPAKRIKRAA
jgi:DNA end-binding protein Ku